MRSALRLRCVECGSALLSEDGDALLCAACGRRFPRVAGIPVLLRSDNQFFGPETGGNPKTSGFNPSVAWIARRLPDITLLRPRPEMLVERGVDGLAGRRRACLVVGGGEKVAARGRLDEEFAEVIVTDVVANPGIDIICDGHDLPFETDAVDLVVINAVLEHVLDPQRVVDEIERGHVAGAGYALL